jgi:hypothetical protein
MIATMPNEDVQCMPGYVVDIPAVSPDSSDTTIDRQRLIHETTVRAIERYHETRRRTELTQSIVRGTELSHWSALACIQENDAERDLITTILAHGADFEEWDVNDSPCRRFEPRGIRLGDHLYLVCPNCDIRDQPTPDGTEWQMRLVILNTSSIVNLDPIEERP